MFALISSVVAARILGKAGYGELGIIQTTIIMFGVLAGMGLGATTTRYVAQYRLTDPERASAIISMSRIISWITSIIMAIALLATAPWLASHSLNAPSLSPSLRLGALLLLFGGINGAQTGALTGFEAFRSVALIGVGSGLASLILMTLGAFLGGVPGALGGLIVSLAGTCAANWYFLGQEMNRAKIPPHPQHPWSELKTLWIFSLPAMLLSMLVIPGNWLSTAVLARQPGGYAELGCYSVAAQWRNLIIIIPTALGGAVFPMLADLYGKGDTAGYKKTVWANLISTSTVAGLGALAVGLLSPFIVRAYGHEFSDASQVIILMAISGFLIALNSVAGNVIMSQGKIWIGCVFCSLLVAILIGTSYLMVPRFGAVGLAYANIAAYSLHTLVQGSYLRHILLHADHPHVST